MSTLLEMQKRVGDASKRWVEGVNASDATEITSLVNQAYLEVVARTRPLITSVAITLTAGVSDYTLSSAPFSLTDIQAIRNFVITDAGTGQSYLLEQCSPEFMALIRQTQVTAGGQMTFWSVNGLNQVSFFPPPAATQVACTLTYQQRPALLALSTDVPIGIPVEFHDLIVQLAISKAIRIYSPAMAGSQNAHDRARVAFNEMLADYRRYLNHRSGAWLARATVKGSRRNTALHGNDIYFTGMDD